MTHLALTPTWRRKRRCSERTSTPTSAAACAAPRSCRVFARRCVAGREKHGRMIAKGNFEVTLQPEPPYDDVAGVTFGRVSIEKRFFGPLEGTAKAQMLAARGPVATSAAYVALDRVTATLAGRSGSFALVHLGLSDRGALSLSVTIV